MGRAIRGHRLALGSAAFRARAAQVKRLIEARPVPAILLLQYLYGLRLVGAVALGLTEFPLLRFVLYQIVTCLVWAGLIGGVGYLLGGLVTEIFHGWFKWIWMIASAVLASCCFASSAACWTESRRRTGAAAPAWDRTAGAAQPPPPNVKLASPPRSICCRSAHGVLAARIFEQCWRRGGCPSPFVHSTPVGPTFRHFELVSDEPPAATVQDRRAPHPTCPLLHPRTGREPLDADALSADSRVHRATRGASDVIEPPAQGGARGRRPAAEVSPRRVVTGGRRSADVGVGAGVARTRCVTCA